MKNLFVLLASGGAHSEGVVIFFIMTTAVFNVLNVYWFLSLLSSIRTPENIGVNSVTIGRQSMKVKWFAFNLNWFDVGFTLTFGDLQTTKLKIDNSSYTAATPGLTVPMIVIAVSANLANKVESLENPFTSSVVVSVATFGVCKVVSWINDRALKINTTLTARQHSTKPTGKTPFHSVPKVERLVHEVRLNYLCVPSLANGGDENLFETILKRTPLPKGRDAFTSVHVIAPPQEMKSAIAEKTLAMLMVGNNLRIERKEFIIHRLSDRCTGKETMDEYSSVFDVASELILKKADRASLVIFIGWDDERYDFYAAMIGMLPFRGVSMALISQRKVRACWYRCDELRKCSFCTLASSIDVFVHEVSAANSEVVFNVINIASLSIHHALCSDTTTSSHTRPPRRSSILRAPTRPGWVCSPSRLSLGPCLHASRIPPSSPGSPAISRSS